MATPTKASFNPSPAALPPGTLDADGLGVLLFKSAETILDDRRRNPKRVPPATVIPGTRQPIWLLSVVLAWLESQVVAVPSPRRGAPTKRERLEKAARASAVGSRA